MHSKSLCIVTSQWSIATIIIIIIRLHEDINCNLFHSAKIKTVLWSPLLSVRVYLRHQLTPWHWATDKSNIPAFLCFTSKSWRMEKWLNLERLRRCRRCSGETSGTEPSSLNAKTVNVCACMRTWGCVREERGCEVLHKAGGHLKRPVWTMWTCSFARSTLHVPEATSLTSRGVFVVRANPCPVLRSSTGSLVICSDSLAW